MNAFTSADDAQHATQIQPGHVVIRGPTHRQLEREVRRSRPRVAVASPATASTGPASAETPPDSSTPPGVRRFRPHRGWDQQRRKHALYQSHVVIEGQPRHNSGVRRRNFAAVLEVVGENLVQVGDARSGASPPHRPAAESTPTCTADRPSTDKDPRSRRSIRGESRSSASISITRGADPPGCTPAYGITSATTADVVSITAGEQSRSAPDTRSS